MPAKSLHTLATETTIKHLRDVTDVGDAPYSVFRKALLKLQNPSQLLEIERNSPQIRGADAELWEAFIKRDIPNHETKLVAPKNPRNWGKAYLRLKAEVDKNKARAEAELKDKLNALSAEKKSQQITFDKTLTVPGTHKRKAGEGPSKPPANPIKVLGPNNKVKSYTGRELIDKCRREAASSRRYFIEPPKIERPKAAPTKVVHIKPAPLQFFTTPTATPSIGTGTGTGGSISTGMGVARKRPVPTASTNVFAPPAKKRRV